MHRVGHRLCANKRLTGLDLMAQESFDVHPRCPFVVVVPNQWIDDYCPLLKPSSIADLEVHREYVVHEPAMAQVAGKCRSPCSICKKPDEE